MFEDMIQEQLYDGAGVSSSDEIQDLLKALQANEGITDIAALTGGGALQPQSLEGTLALLTMQEKHLTLWKDVPKGDAVSTLEEYSVQTGIGIGDEGWVQQMETPGEADPYLKREFATVKFMRQIWKVADVATIVKSIKDQEVLSKQSAILRVLRQLNRSLYSGDSALVGESIDGFEKAIVNNGSTDHVRDLRGGVPAMEDFRLLSELITANLGNADGAGLYVSPGGMTTIDEIMKSDRRVVQNTINGKGGISMGWSIEDIKTSFGRLIPKVDLFLAAEYEGKTVPKIPNPSNPRQLVEGKTSAKAPDTPTVAVATAAGAAGSQFSAGTVRPAAATYNYRVSAGNRFGKSKACAAVNAGANVVAGGKNTITITPSGTSPYPATYYELYSEKVAGSGDFKYLGRIADSGNPTTVYTDLNADIPGTTRMFCLDLTSVGEMRTYMLKRLAPIFSQELAKIGAYRWGMVNMFVTPVYYAPLRYCMLKNVAVSATTKNPLIEV